MPNLQNVLGAMLNTGLGGHRRRGVSAGPAALAGMAGGRGGGGFMRGAGLAALGYLAYRAFQDRQANRPAQGERSTGGAPAQQHEPSLLDRLSGMLNPSGASGGTAAGGTAGAAGQPAADLETAIDDRKAHLLIRAMIAAAYADGQIDPAERQRILGKLEEAGADREDRELVERELRSPASLDQIIKEVDSPETAEQVYVASELAIDADTEAERSYLQYLAARLKLDPQRVRELNQIVT